VVSEIITIALTRILLGEILEEGMLIALICAAPISALLADRQLRMRYLIENQRDQLSVLNGELSARNSDLDAFARTVAHDLKNPLTTIIGMTDLLASDPDPAQTEQTSEFLAAIAQSGDLAIEIIDGLLLLHGIQNESQELVAVDTRETVTSALETLASDIERNAAVVSKSGPLLPVKAHAPWLAQVWINLISNALKYGGSPRAVDLVSQAMPDSMVRFEVTDNGDGIAPEDRERIFTEFERADDTSAPRPRHRSGNRDPSDRPTRWRNRCRQSSKRRINLLVHRSRRLAEPTLTKPKLTKPKQLPRAALQQTGMERRGHPR
ncbi:MAG: HAMP domain-containing histidine kinase, partial [Actinomycetia bacterium]|nr:HAMP domain-containing histidine kinase [Actinomycetes bacterium]